MVNNGAASAAALEQVYVTQNCVIISIVCQNDTDLRSFLSGVSNRPKTGGRRAITLIS